MSAEFNKWWQNFLKKRGRWSMPSSPLGVERIAKEAYQAAQPEWQPIDTAPQVRRILIAFDDGSFAPCDSIDSDRENYSYRGGDVFSLDCATHWMPIPPPPEQAHVHQQD